MNLNYFNEKLLSARLKINLRFLQKSEISELKSKSKSYALLINWSGWLLLKWFL